jgi:hypothetical protein
MKERNAYRRSGWRDDHFVSFADEGNTRGVFAFEFEIGDDILLILRCRSVAVALLYPLLASISTARSSD